jgi:hypothetical protein
METNEKILERVRALIAKAEGTNYPEEADAFRAKADQLMTAHAISVWQVDEAQRGVERVATPTRRDFDRSWRGSKFHSQLFTMFFALARHCRCVVGVRGQTREAMPVYGLPSDLAYLDAMYTSISLEVAKNLQPSVDPNGEIGHEVFKQRQAGIGWEEIVRKTYAAGLLTLTKGEHEKLYDRYHWSLNLNSPDDLDPSEWEWRYVKTIWRDLRNRIANYNRRYTRQNGLQGERNYVQPEVYQRSFMLGFADEIERRIRAMYVSTYNAAADSTGMEVAIRDIRQVALDLYNEEFPPPPPLTEEELKAMEERAKNAPKLPAYRPRMVVVDDGAMSAGRRKARETSLSNNPNRRTGSGSKPELPGS